MQQVVPRLTEEGMPPEELIEAAQGGIAFSLKAEGEQPGVSINARGSEISFRVNQDGPFLITTGAIERLIEQRKGE